MSRKLVLRLGPAVVVLAFVLLGIGAASAPAAFPGANGPFVVERYADLYLVAPDGTIGANLTGTGTDFLEWRPAWSADGAKIAYARQVPGGQGEIWTMGADGSNQQRLATPALAATNLTHPTWSPDGTNIAFVAPDSSETSTIYVQPVDGSAGRTLVPSSFSANLMPDWSPDGSKLVFIRAGGETLRVIAADGSTPAAPLLDENGDAIGGASDPDWSPDGTQIVFVSRFTSARPDGIYVVPAAGGAPRLVVARSFDDDDPVWSPDGTKIAFVGTREGGKQVFTVNVDGSGLTRLTRDAEYYSSVDWRAAAAAPANAAPAASFSVTPSSGTTATSFAFDGSGSSDPDGDALSYAWAFGDGTTGAGSTATHTYAAPGSYTATLTVDDGRGGTNATTRSVTVTSPPPVNRSPSASFTVSPASGTTATSFSFDAGGSSDPDGDSLTYAWAFGDGATGSGATATHTYGVPGTYTATLTVADGRGGTASTTRTVTVTAANAAPTASFTVTPASGTPATSFSFDGSGSSDPDGDALSYAWAFGDGATGSGATATHTYAAAGTYTVTLTVSDGRGGSNATSRSVTVSAPPAGTPPPENRAPAASFAFAPAAPAAGGAVRFDASASSDPDGEALTFAWGFGDGASGSGAVVSHTYSGAGTYTVSMTVTDARGASASASRTVVVAEAARHGLSVRKVGRGRGVVTAVPGPLRCGKICSADFAQGTEVVLRAVPTTGFSFRGWSGGCSGLGSTCTLRISAAQTVTARFEPRRRSDPFTLFVDWREGGAVATWEWGIDGRPVDCGKVCANQFRRDSFVRLVAVPKDNFDFAGWIGACAGQGPWCKLKLSAPRSTSARFAPKPVALSVTKSGEGTVATWEWGLDGGPIDCGSVCVKQFQEGSQVRVVAVPATGFDFAGWTGACAGQGSWCSLTLSGPRATHADFVIRAGASG